MDSAEALGTRLESAGNSLDTLTARLAEQERMSQRMIADIDIGVATLDERFAQLATDGDHRAVHPALAEALAIIDTALKGLKRRVEALPT